MKPRSLLLSSMICVLSCAAPAQPAEVLSAPSHRPGLQVRLRHTAPAHLGDTLPVLFVHGSSFPSALAFDFEMEGMSWMDRLAGQGYDVYALDFLGYGLADRYPEFQTGGGASVGRAAEVWHDIDSAVDLVLRRTGKRQVLLIAHSWGGSVAALYAGKRPGKVAKLVLFSAITARDERSPREAMNQPYEELTPEQRVASMNRLAPAESRPLLAPEVIGKWGAAWLESDRAGVHHGVATVRFPSGPSDDVDDMRHGHPYYDPALIRAPTLLVRGEWDSYPNDADFKRLLGELRNASFKEYVVVPKGTHVMHLEAARFDLYEAVLRFLRDGPDQRQARQHVEERN